MPSWRIVVHALDRTGPPVLARSLLRWLRAAHPDHDVDVVAFRGGELLDDLIRLGPVRVVLDPEEPWNWRAPDPRRVARLATRVAGLPPVDATLLVSVAAGQALPFLTGDDPIVTWVVEQGEELPSGTEARTRRWLAGSQGTRTELLGRLAPGTVVPVVPEFVEAPAEPGAALRQHCRTALGAGDDELLVVGAGIATVRKAPDLFLEVALAHHRAGDGPPARFVWLGGERDPLFHRLRAEVDRLELEEEIRFFGGVVDVVPWLAAADVFLHTARLDAFPLVCLHAAAVGTPVVAFAGVGGVPEMFGIAFVGSPYPDVPALRRNVCDLGGARRRAAVGAAQRAIVLDRFVDDVGGPLVLDQLTEVAAEHAATVSR